MGGILLHIIGLDASSTGMAEMPRKKLAWCQTSRGLRGWPTVRPKRNRVDFLFSYRFESSVILTDLLSLDHTGMAMSGRSLRQLGAYGRYGCITELVLQQYPPGDICWYDNSDIHAKTSMLSIFLSYFCFWRNVYWMYMYISLFRHHNLYTTFPINRDSFKT